MLITRNSILAGLDLGKRRDHSALVLVVREPKRIRVTHATRLPREISYQEQLQAIAAPLAEADLVGLDRSGVGDGVIEMMPRSATVLPVVIVGGTSVSRSNDGSVIIGKQALISMVVQAANGGRLMVDPDAPGRADLRKELTAFHLLPRQRSSRGG